MIGCNLLRSVARVVRYGGESARKVDVTVNLWEPPTVIWTDWKKLHGRKDLVEEFAASAVHPGESPFLWYPWGEIEKSGVIPLVGSVELSAADLATLRDR